MIANDEVDSVLRFQVFQFHNLVFKMNRIIIDNVAGQNNDVCIDRVCFLHNFLHALDVDPWSDM